MAIPLVVSALLAGGVLVPHAAGGLIVSSSAGYVAGTYLSTTAIAGILGAAATSAGAGVAVATGVGRSVLTRFFTTQAATTVVGTTTVATGTAAATVGVETAVGAVTGFLSSPALAYIATGCAIASIGYGAHKFLKLKQKLNSVSKSQEVQFTEGEAKIIELIIRRQAKSTK